LSLRDYQSAAIDALERDWSTGLLRLGVSLPTGTGKTHVMAELGNRYATSRVLSLDDISTSLGKVLVLVHRDTLVEQTERKMREHASPGVTVGVVKAERDVIGANITIASVHTLRNEKRLARIAPPRLIIVDEAHVSMSPTYARIFDRFSRARVAGFSATWVRSDSAKLGDFWQKISFQRSIRWAIGNGHLVMPRGIAIGVPENLLAGVRTGRGGDYRDDDLGEAVSVEAVRDNVTRGYVEHVRDRSAVLFAPTIAAAEYFRAGLSAAGIPAAGIYATTGPRDRRRIFADYRARRIAVLTTCTALAEGWDAPWCSAALMVRPTKHIGLYVQQVGRVLRPWPGKSDALVLDCVGTLGGLSLSLEAVLKQTEVRDDEDTEDREDQDRLEPGSEGEKLYKVGTGTRPVDLFAGTDARWLVTESGVPFIATETHYYFVCQPPETDTWNVGVCRHDRLKGGRWLREGLTSGEAIEFASVVAVDDDPELARADAPWRTRGHPTQAQLYRARSIGCVLSEGDNRGAVADKLTIRQASITLAPIGMR
jgi:superfamily II DNA or RNA helicase